jgi:hypothetical protein
MPLAQMENFTIDQFAGATALILGSVGGLLMIIWKSRCACRCRIGCSDKCYIFDCSRSPPPDNVNDDSDNDDDKNKSPKKKEDKKDDKKKEQLVPEKNEVELNEP